MEEIVKIVQDKIKEIMLVEGEIERFSIIGESIFIKFKNGTRYKQNLIIKNTTLATLD